MIISRDRKQGDVIEMSNSLLPPLFEEILTLRSMVLPIFTFNSPLISKFKIFLWIKLYNLGDFSFLEIC